MGQPNELLSCFVISLFPRLRRQLNYSTSQPAFNRIVRTFTVVQLHDQVHRDEKSVSLPPADSAPLTITNYPCFVFLSTSDGHSSVARVRTSTHRRFVGNSLENTKRRHGHAVPNSNSEVTIAAVYSAARRSSSLALNHQLATVCSAPQPRSALANTDRKQPDTTRNNYHQSPLRAEDDYLRM